MDEITNTDDTIDSRQVIERIRELENMADIDDDGNVTADNLDEDEREELATLRELAKEGETLSDWKYGTTLIRDEYFEDHAQELFEETSDTKITEWPYCHIDWEEAAEALKVDYTAIDFDGETYWAR
jgi:hypothetical protein